MQETWVWSLGWEDPLEKEMETHSSILAWDMPWTEEPGGLQSMGSQRFGHVWVTKYTTNVTEEGLPWWLSGEEPACQCHQRRDRGSKSHPPPRKWQTPGGAWLCPIPAPLRPLPQTGSHTCTASSTVNFQRQSVIHLLWWTYIDIQSQSVY